MAYDDQVGNLHEIKCLQGWLGRQLGRFFSGALSESNFPPPADV